MSKTNLSFPGIFNDAIGPIMRGPSSSHTAGSHRIGQVLRELARNPISSVLFEFHTNGSLATTYHTQGSDIGLAAGLLDIPVTDPGMPQALSLAKEQKLDIQFNILDYAASHPNTYKCRVKEISGDYFEMLAQSTGGGLIEVIELNGIPFSRAMDFPMLMIEGSREQLNKIEAQLLSDVVFRHDVLRSEIVGTDERSLLMIEFRTNDLQFTDENPLLQDLPWRFCSSVYPVLGYTGTPLPFQSVGEIEGKEMFDEMAPWELAVAYESARSGMTQDEIFHQMEELVQIFRTSIETGLTGTSYDDRIMGDQSTAFNEAAKSGKLLPSGPLERITAYVMAIMESKSAMELIVAAPTAGAAGGLPGALIGMAEEINATHDQLIKAFLVAGLLGVFISQEATFAAEVAGCQAETGAGAAMAAAGLIQLSGGNTSQALGAASLALQNVMGLICDPVGNRVEIPCLGRNVQAAANAVISANMILGGVDPVIPLSESIQTMLAVGKALPRELRCTALGGLAVTPTAKRIEQNLIHIEKNK